MSSANHENYKLTHNEKIRLAAGAFIGAATVAPVLAEIVSGWQEQAYSAIGLVAMGQTLPIFERLADRR